MTSSVSNKMAQRSRMVRVPSAFMIRVKQLKQQEKLATNTEAMRKLQHYADIGEVIVKKDLLSANVVWFNKNFMSKKKRGKNK